MMSATAKGHPGKATDLDLSARERNEVRLALRTYVTDLHMEISQTDGYELREELKAKRAVLEKVLRRLGGAAAAVTGQGPQGEAE